MSCIGLDGVSKNTDVGRRRRAPPPTGRARARRRSRCARPTWRGSPRRSRRVDPKRARAATIREPDCTSAASAVNTADMPGRGREAGLGALEQAQALLEGVHRRVAVARVEEPVDVAGERGLGLGGRVVDVALGEEQRLGRLLELRCAGARRARRACRGGARAGGCAGRPSRSGRERAVAVTPAARAGRRPASRGGRGGRRPPTRPRSPRARCTPGRGPPRSRPRGGDRALARAAQEHDGRRR